jgi:hypothetical protein|tara:strand:+ start:68 stop:268 length:201 start_codon:yes stop_codon:yes gene_type:complete
MRGAMMGKRSPPLILELQIPFRFFGALLVGSALLPMAKNTKELALLGGTFLFGLGALEICLRLGGL